MLDGCSICTLDAVHDDVDLLGNNIIFRPTRVADLIVAMEINAGNIAASW